RQDAVKTLALETDVVFVVGSPNSSNSNRLRELAERCGATAYLVDDPQQVEKQWLESAKTIGVTAGASAPEELVLKVVNRLREWGGDTPNELIGREENIVFSMPKELR
ncbi:MAG: 4-hydroxy-3-methylbut-2-enyl diphosphate reductase, partial [Pseudomonadales bacterium]|nr:4-hydroxy-3-methylbut-2-enyl diphosphate reductase [Pseudomonadales bacterium]